MDWISASKPLVTKVKVCGNEQCVNISLKKLKTIWKPKNLKILLHPTKHNICQSIWFPVYFQLFFHEIATHYSLQITFTFMKRDFDAPNQSITPTKFASFEGHPFTLHYLDKIRPRIPIQGIISHPIPHSPYLNSTCLKKLNPCDHQKG